MKNYDVLNELVPKTQELHRAIFDKGYEQGQKDILEQEPCDDCISRENLLKAFKDECRGECDNCPNFRKSDGEYKCRLIADFPSAMPKQQLCDDAVSRQAVHGLIAELLSDYLHDEDREKIEELDVKIEDLEPVTPKEKTGHWIFDEILDRHYYCSECKSMGVDYWDYCPECGAKMVNE